MLVKRCLANAAGQCHNCVLEVVMNSSSLPDLSLSLQEGALPARWTHRGRWAGIYVALRFTEPPPLSAGWALEGAPALSSCVSQNFPYYKVRYRVISPRYSLQGNNLEGREWRIKYEGEKRTRKGIHSEYMQEKGELLYLPKKVNSWTFLQPLVFI